MSEQAPCRHMETRTCPPSGPCAEQCARFESDDPRPWSEAEFSCGQCPHRFTSTNPRDYIRRRRIHQLAHDTVAVMPPQLKREILALLQTEHACQHGTTCGGDA